MTGVHRALAGGGVEPEAAAPATGWTWAAYALAIPLILGLSATMWGVPLPLTDNLSLILQAQSTSLSEILRNGFLEQELLRPFYEALYKVLFALSGGHYYLAFQGFHVAMFAVTVLLCVTALRVRTVFDFVGAGVMLVVLLGLHTFTNVLRELPIIPVTSCALAMTLAFTERPSPWRDGLAALNLVVAMFYVEIGLLVWVIHTAAFICGGRGLSRAGLGVMTAVFAAYFVLRFLVLPAGAPSLFPRYTGVGFSVVDEEELLRRFGDRAIVIYAYNVVASIASVLFSEPRGGVFQFTRRLLEGELRPWMWLNVVSSLAMTGCVAWFLISMRPNWRRWAFGREQAIVLVALAVLVANAVISYPYSRDVTMSPGGVCYAIAAGTVVSSLLSRAGAFSAAQRALMTAVLLLISVTWSLRTIALTYTLRTAAFIHRNEWVGAEQWLRDVGRFPADERGVVLVQTLRREALSFRVPNPGIAQPYGERYLGNGY
jgi:hypothetical protein